MLSEPPTTEMKMPRDWSEVEFDESSAVEDTSRVAWERNRAKELQKREQSLTVTPEQFSALEPKQQSETLRLLSMTRYAELRDSKPAVARRAIEIYDASRPQQGKYAPSMDALFAELQGMAGLRQVFLGDALVTGDTVELPVTLAEEPAPTEPVKSPGLFRRTIGAIRGWFGRSSKPVSDVDTAQPSLSASTSETTGGRSALGNEQRALAIETPATPETIPLGEFAKYSSFQQEAILHAFILRMFASTISMGIRLELTEYKLDLMPREQKSLDRSDQPLSEGQKQAKYTEMFGELSVIYERNFFEKGIPLITGSASDRENTFIHEPNPEDVVRRIERGDLDPLVYTPEEFANIQSVEHMESNVAGLARRWYLGLASEDARLGERYRAVMRLINRRLSPAVTTQAKFNLKEHRSELTRIFSEIKAFVAARGQTEKGAVRTPSRPERRGRPRTSSISVEEKITRLRPEDDVLVHAIREIRTDTMGALLSDAARESIGRFIDWMHRLEPKERAFVMNQLDPEMELSSGMLIAELQKRLDTASPLSSAENQEAIAIIKSIVRGTMDEQEMPPAKQLEAFQRFRRRVEQLPSKEFTRVLGQLSAVDEKGAPPLAKDVLGWLESKIQKRISATKAKQPDVAPNREPSSAAAPRFDRVMPRLTPEVQRSAETEKGKIRFGDYLRAWNKFFDTEAPIVAEELIVALPNVDLQKAYSGDEIVQILEAYHQLSDTVRKDQALVAGKPLKGFVSYSKSMLDFRLRKLNKFLELDR